MDEPEEHTFVLEQSGQEVAWVSGRDRMQALREIMHYAMVYSQDGECTIKGITPDDWQALKR